MQKYKTLQIDAETHSQLQKYCNENALFMSKFVKKLIVDKITATIPKNVLRVKT